MWSDKESKIDFLNFNEIVQSIKEIVTEKNLMPISVGDPNVYIEQKT